MSNRSQDAEQNPNSDINKGRNSVANLRKVAFNNPNVDLFNDIVYTKFGHILSQGIERKPNQDDIRVRCQDTQGGVS